MEHSVSDETKVEWNPLQMERRIGRRLDEIMSAIPGGSWRDNNGETEKESAD